MTHEELEVMVNHVLDDMYSEICEMRELVEGLAKDMDYMREIIKSSKTIADVRMRAKNDPRSQLWRSAADEIDDLKRDNMKQAVAWIGVSNRGTIFTQYGYDTCNSFLLVAGASRLLYILNRETDE